MATIRQVAGKSTRKMETDRRLEQAKDKRLIILFAILETIALAVAVTNNNTWFRIFAVFLMLYLMWKVFIAYQGHSVRQMILIRRAAAGAQAEEKIGTLLESLGDDFVVLHDVKSPYGNIDHVILSQKGGILLLETKSHYGKVQVSQEKILVNGKIPEKDFVQQALGNTFWLREKMEQELRITPWIYPVVVFTNAFVPFGKPVKGVRITNSKFLLEVIQTMVSHSAMTPALWKNRANIVRLLTGDRIAAPIETQASTPSLTEPVACPKCGKAMILRVAQRGPRIGMAMMVCPDYPACYTTLPVEAKFSTENCVR